MRYVLAFAAALLASGVLAQGATLGSEAIPLIDVDKACAASASRTPDDGLATQNKRINLCLQENQKGYDTARLFWDRLSTEHRRECLRHASGFGPSNYYRALGICAEGKFVAGAVTREGRQKPPGFQY